MLASGAQRVNKSQDTKKGTSVVLCSSSYETTWMFKNLTNAISKQHTQHKRTLSGKQSL